MSSIYNTETEAALKGLIKDIEVKKHLRTFYPTQMLCRRQQYIEDCVTIKCKACDAMLKAHFGDYTKALAEQWVPCPNGEPEGKHGFPASVININLN
jgi:hypothetical protein